MFLFRTNRKKQTKSIRVEMRGFVNGREVILPKESAPEKAPSLDYFNTLQREIKPLETKMVELAVAHRKLKTPKEKIASIQQIMVAFETLKKKCNSLGPDFKKYFSKTWEHCHNSRNPDFCYIDPFKKELSELMSKQ